MVQFLYDLQQILNCHFLNHSKFNLSVKTTQTY